MRLAVLCDLCSLVVGSVNQAADMTKPLSLITRLSLGRGGRSEEALLCGLWCFAVCCSLSCPLLWRPIVTVA